MSFTWNIQALEALISLLVIQVTVPVTQLDTHKGPSTDFQYSNTDHRPSTEYLTPDSFFFSNFLTSFLPISLLSIPPMFIRNLAHARWLVCWDEDIRDAMVMVRSREGSQITEERIALQHSRGWRRRAQSIIQAPKHTDHFMCRMSMICALESGQRADLKCSGPVLSRLVATGYMWLLELNKIKLIIWSLSCNSHILSAQ